MKPTKAKILSAASELFAKKGLHALSVRAIATAAGTSTIGIYSHFKGKQGILDAIYIEGFQKVIEATTIDANTHAPKSAILVATANYLATAKEFEGHYRLIFGEKDPSYTPSEEAIAIGAQAFVTLVELVSRILPTDCDEQTKTSAALEIWSLVHGYVSLNHHLISDFIDNQNWQNLALKAVDLHIDAMIKAS